MARKQDFTRDQRNKIWKSIQAFDRLLSSYPDETTPFEQVPVVFRNDSGATIPPFGMMQVTGCVNIVSGGRNYVKVRQPIGIASVQCPLLFNGSVQIKDNGFGAAQFGPVFRVKTDGGTYDPGDRLGPKDTTFTATFGSMYSVLGSDDIESNVVRVMFDTSMFRGKTVVAMAAGTPSNCYAYAADGSLTSKQYLAETIGTTIPINTDVLLFPQYGRLFAVRLC